MAALHNLPVEVLFQICSALCHKRVETGGRTEISRRLLRTCRRLRDVAQLLIFTAVDLSEFTRARQIKLIRTLSTRPDLAQHLKVLVINPTSNEPDLSPADIAYVKSLITKFHLPARIFTDWHNGTNRTHPPSPHRAPPLARAPPHPSPPPAKLRLGTTHPFPPRLAAVRKPTSSITAIPHLRILQISHYYILGDRFDVPFSEFLSIYAAALNLQEL